MSTLSRTIRGAFLLSAVALVTLGVSVATASASSCLCFHTVYTGADSRIHDSAYNTTSKAWSDQIAPGSVPANPDPYAAMTDDNFFHVVYVSKTGYVHDDAQNPTTHTWLDQIPPLSVKAAGTPTVLSLHPLSGTDVTLHIVYLGQDGWVHNDQFDPKTNAWFDQIPLGSVPAAGSPVAEDGADYGFFRIVYLGKDGRVHEDRFNKALRTWSDSIVPQSVPAISNPRIGVAVDGSSPPADEGFHVVYVGTDNRVHNDREDVKTGTWYDQVTPGSITPYGTPTFAAGIVAGFSHVLYLGSDGHVHLDTYNDVSRTWLDGIPPYSIPAATSPNGSTTYDDTFQLVYTGSDGRIHDDVYHPSIGAWTDSIPIGSVPANGNPAVANVDN